MGFVTKEKLFSKDFFITYGWLFCVCIRGCIICRALRFCSWGNIWSVYGISSFVGVGD